jgi:hypothetical protein
MRKYRIKEYDKIDNYDTTKVVKRYQIEWSSGWPFGWQEVGSECTTEAAARNKIEAFKVQEEVHTGKRVRYIDVE